MKTYLFFDKRTVHPQGISNARLKVCPVHKDTVHGALFSEEYFADTPRSWEVRYDNGYPNVIYDEREKLYRCYYTLFFKDPDSAGADLEMRKTRHYTPLPERRVGLAYAQSADGIHWEKPSLGFVEFEGSRDNNLLFQNAHGTGVMLDEREKDPSRRYKLVTKMDFSDGTPGFMAVNFSSDGVHWGEMQPWADHNPPGDSHNLPFYDRIREKYCVMTRCWRDGVRVETLCESDDFLHWSAPVEVARGAGFSRQVYSMPVFLWHDLYLGLASVFHEGDRTTPDFDTVDCELYYAVTPDVFDSVAPGQPFISRGEGSYLDGAFDCGCIYTSVPVEIDGKLYFYYMGGNGRHTDYRETSLARGWIEKDRFACYQQRDSGKEGVLSSAQLTCGGGAVYLLADIPGDAYVKASIRHRWNGEICEGFAEEDCRLQPCSDGLYRIEFARPWIELKGMSVCLALRFSGARLYGLQGDLTFTPHRLWEGAPVLKA